MQPVRQTADRLQVVRHVVATQAVPACGPLDELAILVCERDSNPVDLQFDDIGDGFVPQHLANPLVELAQLCLAVSVVDREHRQPVRNGDEPQDRLAAGALRRTVRRHQFRMLLFDLFQFFEELVEFPVGDFGLGVNVVLVVVVVDLLAEFFRATTGLFKLVSTVRVTGHVKTPETRFLRETGFLSVKTCR